MTQPKRIKLAMEDAKRHFARAEIGYEMLAGLDASEDAATVRNEHEVIIRLPNRSVEK